jgi:hypothetical protein
MTNDLYGQLGMILFQWIIGKLVLLFEARARLGS